LRQIGTGETIWWRASQSPAPSTTRRPVPTAATAVKLRRPLVSPRRHTQRKLQRALTVAGVALAGATAFLAIAGSAGTAPQIQPSIAEIERMLDLAGYGLTQVALTGHRLTPDSDIFDAIDLGSTPTMLSFDSRAARARIERLPSVARASIERVFPDRIEVHVTEREPFAVWSRGSRHFLIDKTGHVLSAVSGMTAPSLPRFAGEGAAAEAADLYALLSHHPALLRRVALAERVAERRWRLRLAGGSAIELPADGLGQALAQALQLVDAAARQGANEIDLRVPGRALVRQVPERRQVVGQAPEAPLATGGI
jgi:cell division protein FtsQ